MERQEIFREIFHALAIVMLIALFIATLAVINRPSDTSRMVDPSRPPVSDDLSAELYRCSTLGPRDAEDSQCEAVWEENRQRFFGRPARPVPPGAAPANNPMLNPTTAGDAP